jgi:hypothetical protein
MARQMGQLPIKGTIDQLTFYYHPDDGHLVRTKSSITKERIFKDSAYSYFVECGKEFGDAIYAGHLIRNALSRILFPVADGKLSSRMNTTLLQAIQADTAGPGERTLEKGNPLLLLHFEFNNKLALDLTFKGDYITARNKASNECYLSIPGFTINNKVAPPEYASHFQFLTARIMINFDQGYFKTVVGESISIPLSQPVTEDLHFILPAGSLEGGMEFLVFGIRFAGKLDNIPRNAISQRKRQKLKKGQGADDIVFFTGALKIIRVIPPGHPNDGRQQDDPASPV